MRWLLCVFSFCFQFSYADEISESKVLICGVAKNVEKAIPCMTESIEKLGSHFADYQVIVYENNSTDNTVSLFEAWENRNKRVSFLSETLRKSDLYNRGQGRQLYRTELIARARNIVLQLAMQPKYDDFRYVIMIDLDFGKPLDIEGILSSFHFTEEWDGIFANGIAPNGEYWDWYAFRDIRYPFGPELYGSEWWTDMPNWRKHVNLAASDPFLPVISAFGGLAIYKRESIRDCYYSGLITEDLSVIMQEIISANNPKSRHVISHYFANLHKIESFSLPKCHLQWFADSYLYEPCPTVCEHVPFHASMIRKKHGKLFINPRMVMKYWECM